MVGIREKQVKDILWLPSVKTLRDFLRGYSLSGKQVIITHRVLCSRKFPLTIIIGMYSQKRWADSALDVLINMGLLKKSGALVLPTETLLVDLSINVIDYWSENFKLKVVSE